jgi:hypothetical protein
MTTGRVSYIIIVLEEIITAALQKILKNAKNIDLKKPWIKKKMRYVFKL